MRTDLVFNDLSLVPAHPSVAAAQEAMNNFIETITACRKLGIGGTLRLPRGFSFLALADEYPISRWQNDRIVPREKRLFIGTLATKAPYFEDLLGSDEAVLFEQAEFELDGVRADGLGVAHTLDAVGISLSKEPPWDQNSLVLTHRALNDETGDILESQVRVRHVSVPEHSAVHGQEFQRAEEAAVDSGRSFWEACPHLFPRLSFCASVESQIKRLTLGSGGLAVVFRTFKEMQLLSEGWVDGPFDSTAIPNTTREGPATLQQFGEERTFIKPDGIPEVFSWHAKRGAIRIHFLPDSVHKGLLVGYVGPHLRTVKNK